MDILIPVVRSYPWGSRTALPEMCGTNSPASQPIAEYWFGAHPSGASQCSNGRGLDYHISADPIATLGERVVIQFGARLPFLVKLLSAEQALSLQAHPSLRDARKGFSAEDAVDIPIDAANRNYRDSNHKPEVLAALTEFHALVGFRPVDQTLSLLGALNVPPLDPFEEMLREHPGPEGIRKTFTSFAKLPHDSLSDLIARLKLAASNYLASMPAGAQWSFEASTLLTLAKRYPSDSGVLGALLLNRVVLRPGESIYLGPGQLHSYLGGTGVEVMANSDNVLRGGLTDKHIDFGELVRIMDFDPINSPILHPTPATSGLPGEVSYSTPVADFALSRVDLPPSERTLTYHPYGPEILLCTAGSVCITNGSDRETIYAGSAIWLPSSCGGVTLKSPSGASIFRTRIGDTD